jgi:hypothetical protein
MKEHLSEEVEDDKQDERPVMPLTNGEVEQDALSNDTIVS